MFIRIFLKYSVRHVPGAVPLYFRAANIVKEPFIMLMNGSFFHRLDLVAAAKKIDALGDVGGSGGYPPQLLGLYFFFSPF